MTASALETLASCPPAPSRGESSPLLRELAQEAEWYRESEASVSQRALAVVLKLYLDVTASLPGKLGVPAWQPPRSSARGLQRAYQRRGYVLGDAPVVSTTLMDAIREDAEHIHQTHAALSIPAIQYLNSKVLRLCAEESVLDFVRETFRSSTIRLVNATIHFKPPGAAQTPWHTDGGETTSARVWLSLVDSTVDNGCLRLVEASHQLFDEKFVEVFYSFSKLHRYRLTGPERRQLALSLAKLALRDPSDAGLTVRNYFSTSMAALFNHYRNVVGDQRMRRELGALPVIDLETKAGQLIAFSTSILHAAYRNSSPSSRPALGLVYGINAHEDTRYCDLPHLKRFYGADVAQFLASLNVTEKTHIPLSGDALSVHALSRQAVDVAMQNWAGRSRFERVPSQGL